MEDVVLMKFAKKGMAASLLVAVAAVAATTGCAGESVPAGPAEVSVAKPNAPTPVEGSVESLTELDITKTTGAAHLDWGATLGHVWLPQAIDAVPGIDGTTDRAGSVYLRVPAEFDNVAARVASEQDQAAFTGYLEVDVPASGTPSVASSAGATSTPVDDAAPTAPTAPAGSGTVAPPQVGGKVIQGARDGVKYTVTISPDDVSSGFTIVMVKWEPDTAPTSAPAN